MAEPPKRRSRFDVGAPAPDRRSRFDQRDRSRSPRRETDHSDNHRQRTESPRVNPQQGDTDAAARAREAASRIAAEIAARKAQQLGGGHSGRAIVALPEKSRKSGGISGEIYQQDGDYIKDIEVNDLRNRYTLTKGATHKMIKEQTGADVTTRGEYYPDKNMATPTAPPLYLHITSQTKEGLEQAVAKIEELMQQELPNLVDERRFRRTTQPEQVERDERGRRKWPEERLSIDMEPIPGFNLCAQIVGAGGAYVKHIRSVSDCRVQIKGRGSGFIENNTGMESDEPMYLHITGSHPDKVAHAKSLCEDLLKSVKKNYDEFKERGPSRGHGRDGHGRGHDHRSDSYGRGYGSQSYNSSGTSNGNIMSSAAGPTATAAAPTGAEYAAQWAAYYAQSGVDPYAAYGGYENYARIYQQYYYNQSAGTDAGYTAAAPGTTVTPGPPADQAPPPPPPPASTENVPPPPPPPQPSGAPGMYSQVPPPPGM